jgi:hypothetical protein
LASHHGVSKDYVCEVVNQGEVCSRGRVHTNSLENHGGLFGRCIKGPYVSVEPFHLFRYLDEEDFRFNNRKKNDAARFMAVAANVVGKRLTFAELTGAVESKSEGWLGDIPAGAAGACKAQAYRLDPRRPRWPTIGSQSKFAQKRALSRSQLS